MLRSGLLNGSLCSRINGILHYLSRSIPVNIDLARISVWVQGLLGGVDSSSRGISGGMSRLGCRHKYGRVGFIVVIGPAL